jgi:glycosyltransferase involved in cell wall biosynthesis
VIVINGGAECDNLIAYDMNVARRHINITNYAFIVGMSNVCKEDHDDNLPFFEALAKLSKSNSHLRLLVTGEPKYILDAVKPLLPPNILIDCGWPDFKSYNRLLSACDVFALPYPNTPKNAARWPNKLGDYLSLNRPVITNPTGDLRDFFSQYRLGYLCENMTQQYIKTLTTVLRGKEQLAHAAADSLSVAREQLAFPKRVERILRYYEFLLSKKKD